MAASVKRNVERAEQEYQQLRLSGTISLTILTSISHR